MYQMIANAHDFQVSVRVDCPDGTVRNVSLPPRQRGNLRSGETVSAQSLMNYPKLRVAEVPEESTEGSPNNESGGKGV